MNESAQKIQQVINILAGLTPRVDQVATISTPIAHCINMLVDVRESLNNQEESPK